MSEKRSMTGAWTEVEEIALCDCVTSSWAQVMGPLKGSGYTQPEFFWFVAGRLYHEIGKMATGPACARRWGAREEWYHLQLSDRMEAERIEAEKKERDDATMKADREKWDEVWNEQDDLDSWIQEHTVNTLDDILGRVMRVEHNVTALCRSWDVEHKTEVDECVSMVGAIHKYISGQTDEDPTATE